MVGGTVCIGSICLICMSMITIIIALKRASANFLHTYMCARGSNHTTSGRFGVSVRENVGRERELSIKEIRRTYILEYDIDLHSADWLQL